MFDSRWTDQNLSSISCCKTEKLASFVTQATGGQGWKRGQAFVRPGPCTLHKLTTPVPLSPNPLGQCVKPMRSTPLSTCFRATSVTSGEMRRVLQSLGGGGYGRVSWELSGHATTAHFQGAHWPTRQFGAAINVRQCLRPTTTPKIRTWWKPMALTLLWGRWFLLFNI